MTLSKPPLPKPATSKVDAKDQQFLSLNQQVLAGLITFVDFAEGFTLGLVEINFPPDVDTLIQALQIHPDCQEIQFEVLDFSDQPDLRFLRDEIVKILPTIQRESDKELVLIVRGLAKAIGTFGDYPPVLQDLNFVRDAYKTSVPYPMLFVLPDYAITRLAKFAPDFWAWKSGIFLFRTPEATKDSARAQTIDSPQGFGSYYLGRPEDQERIDLLERLLMEYWPNRGAISPENLSTCSTILHQLGKACLSRHKITKAKEYLDEASKLAEQQQDRVLIMEVNRALGNTYEAQRDFALALESYQASLKLAQELGNQNQAAIVLHDLGDIYKFQRDLQNARSFYKQTLRIWEELNSRYSQASTYHQLGMVAQDLREYDEARRNYQQALEIYIEYGDRYSQALTYHQLGAVAQDLREYEEARRNYQQALEIYIEFGDRYEQADTCHQLGMVAQDLREYEEARRNYQQALDIYVEYGDRYSQADTYGQLGLLAEAQKNYEEARTKLKTALDIFTEFKDEYKVEAVRQILDRIGDR